MHCEHCTIFTPSALHYTKNRTTSTSTNRYFLQVQNKQRSGVAFSIPRCALIESDQSDGSLSFHLANPFQSSRSPRLSMTKRRAQVHADRHSRNSILPVWRLS